MAAAVLLLITGLYSFLWIRGTSIVATAVLLLITGLYSFLWILMSQ